MWTVSAYRHEHREAVLNIVKGEPKVFSDFDVARLRVELRSPGMDVFFWVVHSNADGVVGFVSLGRYEDSASSWAIRWLGVDGKARRSGVATLLCNAVETEARDMMLRHLYVETCSCAASFPARKLYLSRGYRELAMLLDFYDRGHHKKILFRWLR